MLHAAADRLRTVGYDVSRAYVSPSHDGYVQPKAANAGTFGLSASFRVETARHAVAHDPLVDVGSWEACKPGGWPDPISTRDRDAGLLLQLYVRVVCARTGCQD